MLTTSMFHCVYMSTDTSLIMIVLLLLLQGAALDPLLDDVVAMAHKLKSIDQPVTLNVLDNLPHGFLSVAGASNNANLMSAQKLCVEYIKKELHIARPTRQKMK